MTAGATLGLPAGATVLDDGTLARTELVTPGMCGQNSLFVGRLGDWTWDAVGAACDVNVYAARNEGGDPTYLSFYYFRVRSGAGFHPLQVSFGDRLKVASRVFGFGSESVLTLHRLRRDDGLPVEAIDPDRFYRFDDPDCIFVENFNRWIARSRADSNQGLIRASPVGFRHEHLPRLPDRFSPRPIYARARETGSFRSDADRSDADRADADRSDAVRFRVDYPVEASRDLNGVGLLYFASYFSVVDWAVLRLWRHLGRGHRAFLHRAVLDHQLCYVGNADADAVLRVELTAGPVPDGSGEEIVDTVIRERDTGALLAVSTQRILPPARTSRDPEAPPQREVTR